MNHYIFEQFTDAVVTQRWDASEKSELLYSLNSMRISNWDASLGNGIYSERETARVIEKLSKVDLGDQKTIRDIKEFISSERIRNPNTWFEKKFRILEKYLWLADTAKTETEAAKTNVTKVATLGVAWQRMIMSDDSGARDRESLSKWVLENMDARKLVYNREQLKGFTNIADILKNLDTGIDEQKNIAKLLRDVQKTPTDPLVKNLQAQLISMSGTVSTTGIPDGWFGPLTIAAIIKVAGWEVVPKPSDVLNPNAVGLSVVWLSSPAAGSSTSTGKPTVNPLETSKTDNKKVGQKWYIPLYSDIETSKNIESQLFLDKQWRVWAIGKNGEKKTILSQSLNAEGREILKKQWEIGEIVQLGILVVNWLQTKPKLLKNSSQKNLVEEFMKISSSDDAQSANLDGVKKQVEEFFTGKLTDTKLSLQINRTLTRMSSWDSRRIDTYKIVREKFWAYDSISSEILSRNIGMGLTDFNDENIQKLYTLVNEWNTPEYIAENIATKYEMDNPFFTSLRTLFTNNRQWLLSFSKSIVSARKDIQIHLAKNEEDARMISGQSKKPLDEVKKTLIQRATVLAIEKWLLNQYIINKPTSQVSEELRMYGNIEGVGQYGLMSDKTYDTAKLVAEAAAFEMVALGVGFLTAWVATWAMHTIAGARYASLLARWYSATSGAGNIAKMGTYGLKWAEFAVKHGWQWLVFWVWYANAKFIMDEDSSWGSEVAKSAGYSLAFWALGSLYSKLWVSLIAGRPLMEQVPKFIAMSTVDALTIGGIEYTFRSEDKKNEWTPEELLHWLMLAATMRLMGHSAERFIFKKDKNWIIAEIDKDPKFLNKGKWVAWEIEGLFNSDLAVEWQKLLLEKGRLERLLATKDSAYIRARNDVAKDAAMVEIRSIRNELKWVNYKITDIETLSWAYWNFEQIAQRKWIKERAEIKIPQLEIQREVLLEELRVARVLADRLRLKGEITLLDAKIDQTHSIYGKISTSQVIAGAYNYDAMLIDLKSKFSSESLFKREVGGLKVGWKEWDIFMDGSIKISKAKNNYILKETGKSDIDFSTKKDLYAYLDSHIKKDESTIARTLFVTNAREIVARIGRANESGNILPGTNLKMEVKNGKVIIKELQKDGGLIEKKLTELTTQENFAVNTAILTEDGMRLFSSRFEYFVKNTNPADHLPKGMLPEITEKYGKPFTDKILAKISAWQKKALEASKTIFIDSSKKDRAFYNPMGIIDARTGLFSFGVWVGAQEYYLAHNEPDEFKKRWDMTDWKRTSIERWTDMVADYVLMRTVGLGRAIAYTAGFEYLAGDGKVSTGIGEKVWSLLYGEKADQSKTGRNPG